jgi:hypothetical protein
MRHLAAKGLHLRNDLVDGVKEIQCDELDPVINQGCLDGAAGRDDDLAPADCVRNNIGFLTRRLLPLIFGLAYEVVDDGIARNAIGARDKGSLAKSGRDHFVVESLHDRLQCTMLIWFLCC